MAKIGLFGKYLLAKSDGTEIEPESKYFVLRYDSKAASGEVSRIALVEYCERIKNDMPDLASELMADLKIETDKAIQSLLD
jgi:hypothetical protein